MPQGPHPKHRRVPVGFLLALFVLSCTFYTTFRHVSLLDDLHIGAASLSSSSARGRYSVLGAEEAKDRVITELKDKILRMEQLHKSLELQTQVISQERQHAETSGLLPPADPAPSDNKPVEEVGKDAEQQLAAKIGNLRKEAAELERSVEERRREAAELAQQQQQQQQQQEEEVGASSDPGGAVERAWLVVGIPSFARPNNVDYLGQTLESIARQLPTDPSDPFYGRVRVVVMNNYGAGHATFDAARERLGGGLHPAFEFVVNDGQLKDPLGEHVKDPGSPNKPGFRVRKQTRDLVALLRHAQGRGEHYLFLEDDMLFCPHALLAFHYLLSKASLYHPDWLSVRASYGMNGIFLHDKDVRPFAQYLLDHQARRPPDHLVVEWFAGEKEESARHKGSRAHVSFRFNLFHHIGSVSSLRSENQVTFPVCYEALGEPVLFHVEAFQPHECPHDDVWPCRPPGDERAKLMPRIDWGQLRAAAN